MTDQEATNLLKNACNHTKAWRRLRDICNKQPEIRKKICKNAILGGIAPQILKGMDEGLEELL